MRLRGPPTSAPISSSRPSRSATARTSARSAPARPGPPVGAPRHLVGLEQDGRVERSGQFAALVLAVESLVGLTDVLGAREELETVIRLLQADGGRRHTSQQLHPPQGIEKTVARHGELVGLA